MTRGVQNANEIFSSYISEGDLTGGGVDEIDYLSGSEGNDRLIGGAGNDKMDAGANSTGDVLVGDNGRIGASNADNAIWSLDYAFAEARALEGASVDATLFAGNDLLSGSAGVDIIIGGMGADNIIGHASADFLFGDAAYITLDN